MAPLFQQPFMSGGFPSMNRATAFDDTGLKAYYKFNESSGNLINVSESAADLGSAADGTASGGPTYSTTGKIGNAISFDGTGDQFQLGSSLSQWNFLHDGTDATISWWMKLNATETDDQSGIMGTSTGSGSVVGFEMLMDDRSGSSRDHKLQVLVSNGSAAKFINTSDGYIPKNTTTWYHYIYTYTGDATPVIDVYRDNANNESDSTGFTESGSNATYAMQLANIGNNAANNFDFILDEMSIFARKITSDERASLYNSGSGLEIY